MATSIQLKGKSVTIPGAYSDIKSGIRNPALALSYGNTLVIDTGSNKFFAGGPGINGTLKNGINTIATFDSLPEFRKLVRGGPFWLLAEGMFLPGGGATAGISSLSYLRAATTVPAEITMLFGAQVDSNDGDAGNDGNVVVQVKDEGFIGNGVFGDEVRAKATITVTNAGAAGDVISVSYAGITWGTYTVQTGNNIAAVVAGLAASLTANGIVTVFSSTSPNIVVQAPWGQADDINGQLATITVQGTVNGSSGSFSGGVEGTKLTRGYAAKLITGVQDSSKFILQFIRGTFKGLDTSISLDATPAPYDGIAELATTTELVCQSPEVSTVQELVTWMQDVTGSGYAFAQFFKLKSYVVAATDEVIVEDLLALPVKAVGGYETYSSSDLTSALEAIAGFNYDFILADNWGDNARSANNLAIFNYIVNDAKIKPDLYIAGGDLVGKFQGSSTASVELAQAYDNMNVTIVHGGADETSIGGKGYKHYKAIYKAAKALGREAGLPPQVPLTFKGIGIQGEAHPLKQKEIIKGLAEGVLMTVFDNGSYEIVKGINTAQSNDFLVNADATTHSKQLSRIIRQLNKEITVNAKRDLLKKPNGANRNTVSPEDVKAWLEGYLSDKVAIPSDDDLILSFRAVEVSVQGDAYSVTYAFTPNFEISFIVFTGVIIDPAN